jgi:hypothetical protein
MNKLILKQKGKGKEKKTIFINHNDIEPKLIRHFSKCIGEEDKTTMEEIFQAVVGFNSDMLTSLSKYYWATTIQKKIRELRKNKKCFVMKKKGKYFIANKQEEIDYFENICNRAKKGMDDTTLWGREWVDSEGWKNMKIPEDKTENTEDKIDKEQTKTFEDKISEINKLKTKVIRLWKGEKEE